MNIRVTAITKKTVIPAALQQLWVNQMTGFRCHLNLVYRQKYQQLGKQYLSSLWLFTQACTHVVSTDPEIMVKLFYIT